MRGGDQRDPFRVYLWRKLISFFTEVIIPIKRLYFSVWSVFVDLGAHLWDQEHRYTLRWQGGGRGRGRQALLGSMDIEAVLGIEVGDTGPLSMPASQLRDRKPVRRGWPGRWSSFPLG